MKMIRYCFWVLTLLISVPSESYAQMDWISCLSVLNPRDVKIMPGETKRIVFDFTRPECYGVDIRGLAVSIGDANVSVSGCTNKVAIKNSKVEMLLVNQTTGLVGLKPYSTYTYLYDPRYVYVNETPVSNDIVSLDLTLPSSVSRCANISVRGVYQVR